MPSVLVVDDYADTREFLSVLLSGHGYQVFTAENGKEGIRVALEKLPHVIIMDIFMPVMDGFEATRHLKADPATAHTPVIAYTARPTPIETQKHLFTAICQKPCPPAVLLALLERSIA